MIEESNRNETKHQAGTSPEPDVLMENVEYDDSKNKQELFHGGPEINKAVRDVSSFWKIFQAQKGTSVIKMNSPFL